MALPQKDTQHNHVPCSFICIRMNIVLSPQNCAGGWPVLELVQPTSPLRVICVVSKVWLLEILPKNLLLMHESSEQLCLLFRRNTIPGKTALSLKNKGKVRRPWRVLGGLGLGCIGGQLP